MSIEKRIEKIEKLEKHSGAGKPERKTWVLVDREPEPAGIAEIDTVIRVGSREARELTLRILAGEGTGPAEASGGKP